MRWQAKAPTEYGTRRNVRRFAWWPTHVDDDTPGGCYLWLEPYVEEQVYQCRNEYGSMWEVCRRRPVQLPDLPPHPGAAEQQGARDE